MEIQETCSRIPHSRFDLQHMRIFLCADHQFRSQQALGLVLRGVRPIYHVGDKLRPERQRQIVAVDVPGFILIDNKEIVALLAYGNIRVFAEFDIALSAENEEPSIAPCAEAVRSEPIEAHVTEAVVAAQHHVAKVLKLRMAGMTDIRYLGCDDFCLSRACVIQELIDLVRANVAENTAELDVFPEPGRPAVDGACASGIASRPLPAIHERETAGGEVP